MSVIDLELCVAFKKATGSHLKPFKFTLVPRTEKASALVEEALR